MEGGEEETCPCQGFAIAVRGLQESSAHKGAGVL